MATDEVVMEISSASPYTSPQSNQNIETEMSVAVLRKIKTISEENATALIDLVENATSSELSGQKVDFYA